MAAFRANNHDGSLRQAHDALRQLWLLSHSKDVPVARLRIRIQELPKMAVEYLDRRAARIGRRVFDDLDGRTELDGPDWRTELPKEAAEYLDQMRATVPVPPPSRRTGITRFQEWAIDAPPNELILLTRALSGEGQRMVKGRSRGDGKRAPDHFEPVIMGQFRGDPVDTEASILGPSIPAAAKSDQGGRPLKDAEYELVMHLAIDWSHALGDKPRSGRSGNSGFGDLVHSVFQWMGLRNKSAIYALRRYWADVERAQNWRSSKDFRRFWAPSLPKAAQVALRALGVAIKEKGEQFPASTHIAGDGRVVRIEHWRHCAYQAGISSGGARARQVAFKRAHEKLVEGKHVCAWEEYRWPASLAGEHGLQTTNAP
jgi:hypothetical protein